MSDQENTTDSTNSTETTDGQTPAADQTNADQKSSDTTDNDDTDESILGGAKDGDDTDEAGDKKGEEEKPNALLGAPEGDYELTGLPEGTVIDKEALADLTPIAKEVGLSNEGLSRFAQVYAEKILPRVAEQIAAGTEQQIAAIHKEWDGATRKAVAEDPIYEGKPFKEVTQIAARALDRLGSPELRKALNDSGFGNNPELVRFAFRAGLAISEDSFERGDGNAPQPKTLQSVLYGNKEK